MGAPRRAGIRHQARSGGPGEDEQEEGPFRPTADRIERRAMSTQTSALTTALPLLSVNMKRLITVNQGEEQ